MISTNHLKHKISPDFRLGLYYKEPKWYTSASVVNLTRNTDYGISSYFSSGTTLFLTNGISLNPEIGFQFFFDKNKKNEKLVHHFSLNQDNIEFSFNTSIEIYDKFTFSTRYGQNLINKDHSIFLRVNIEVSKTLKLGTTYELEIKKHKSKEEPIFEISLTSNYNVGK